MKISGFDGSLEFAAGRIEPRLGRTAFAGSPLGMTATVTHRDHGWAEYRLQPEPGVWVTVYFHDDRLVRLFVLLKIPADESDAWTEGLELERKKVHDDWLRTELGKPPYEYAWGSITSDYDPRGCVSEIIVIYGSQDP
ncbi:MAG TPA: hypothetical protein VH856_02780 [Steroidobacteraceae bacterium]|jgi:hypothetical protein